MATTWCAVLFDSDKKDVSIQFLKFLFVGLGNTGLGVGMIYLGKWQLGLNDLAANTFGYAIGIAFSFFMNSKLTFAYRGGHFGSAVRFLLAALGAYLLNVIVVGGAIYGFGVHGDFAQLLGVPPYTIFFYLASKHFVFVQPIPSKGVSENLE